MEYMCNRERNKECEPGVWPGLIGPYREGTAPFLTDALVDVVVLVVGIAELLKFPP